MARDDSPGLAAARLEVGKALANFAKVYRAENGDDAPILEGWAAIVTYTTVDLTAQDVSGTLWVVPTDQVRALTVGMFTEASRGF